MADFSSHHSVLKMPAALTNGHSLNLSGLLFYSPSHGQAAPATANEIAAPGGGAMAEDASLESSAVLDTSPEGNASPPDRRRKATEDSATLSSAHSKDCKEGKSKRGKRPNREAEEKSTIEDEAPKGYIHVRARKGQATNRHSLAERLRREKISERMKLLQDLVPGCSKVTGKAVMLDEIINYVQSLQRHVEFLSMKLATVSPALNLNIEGLLSKNRLSRFPRAALSAPIGFSFSQETMPEPQLLSQSGMLQRGVHDMGNGPDVFRTVMQEQLNEKDLYRDAASQMPHTLDGSSFHDVAQMGYRSVIGSEDLSVRGDQDGFHM